MKNKKPTKVDGKVYTKSCFFWAVMYRKNYITKLFPNHSDARTCVFHNNKKWQEQGWAPQWSVKRFMFRFKGSEIDAYEHEWKRKEK